MSPENHLAVVSQPCYTLEFRAYNDDAWYSVAISLEGQSHLRIKYFNFSDGHDNVFEATDFKTVKQLDDFKGRFRPLSKQLQDNECRQLMKGVKVCACHSFSHDDVRFYDAVVDGELVIVNGILTFSITSVLNSVVKSHCPQLPVEGLHIFIILSSERVLWVVLKREHFSETAEELCSCRFILLWLHGPNYGNLTDTTIENICIVQPVLELDPVVASFLKVARERAEFISSRPISMSKGVSGWETVAYCNEGLNTPRRLGFFERLQKEKRRAKRSVVKFGSSEVSRHHRRMEESDLEGMKNQCVILIGNLDKELCPSTIAEFLRRHASASPQVFIFPSLSLEIYTRGAIVLDSEKDFQKLCEFLDNPNHIITSSTGRPWVIMEKLVGLKKIKASIGTLVPVSKIILQNGNSGTSNNLKVVRSGTQEFKIASDLRNLFLEFTNHQAQLYKKLALEERKILAV